MTTETEPTFRIEIRACAFHKLNLVELTKKLKLMHDLNFTSYYTIVEDTEVQKPKIEIKPV